MGLRSSFGRIPGSNEIPPALRLDTYVRAGNLLSILDPRRCLEQLGGATEQRDLVPRGRFPANIAP